MYRLAKMMRTKDQVSFAYEKKDGSLRRAYGTLKNVGQFVKGTGKTSTGAFHYWDLEAAAFRCFRVENLVTTFNQ